MSVEGARMRLQGSLNELLMKWSEVEPLWRDATSENFRRRYIESLEAAVKAALPAMEKMAETLHRVRMECGDPR